MVLLSGAASAPLHARSSSSTAASPIALTQEAVQRLDAGGGGDRFVKSIITFLRETMPAQLRAARTLEEPTPVQWGRVRQLPGTRQGGLMRPRPQ